MLLAFPWLFVSFALYNAIAFLSETPVSADEVFMRPLASVHMVSGAVWQLTTGFALVALTSLFLMLELLRAARLRHVGVLDRVLSTLLFLTCLVEFILRKEAATSVFFIITIMAFIDVVVGLAFVANPAKQSATDAS